VNYPSPLFIKSVYPTLLDYANFMACYFKDRLDKNGPDKETVRDVVKFCAWFFYSFVSLHPFSDGNGRMSRLLYFYIQSLLSPFAVGVYNIYSSTNKTDYYKAIRQVREENRRSLESEESQWRKNNWIFKSKPSELATMILECQWHAWKEFDSKNASPSLYNRQLSVEILNSGSLEDYFDEELHYNSEKKGNFRDVRIFAYFTLIKSQIYSLIITTLIYFKIHAVYMIMN